MTRLIGVPVVRPSKVPERIRTRSGSWRGEVCVESPGRRRSSQGWMSASLSARPGGQPSTTAPMAGPWLSPQVVKRKTRPKLLQLIRHRRAVEGGGIGGGARGRRIDVGAKPLGHQIGSRIRRSERRGRLRREAEAA